MAADLFSSAGLDPSSDPASSDDTAESSAAETPASENESTVDNDGVLSVTELTEGLGALVEKHYGDVRVEGELSNFKRAASGHCYFTLKDDDAQIRCVMWRYLTQHIYFEPEDGLLVRITGKASVYERRGDLQILVNSMRRAGKGAQQEAFERLKAKLKAEGLFDRDRKKPLPTFPRRIGVVTSGEGAALQDILSVLERRFAAADVILCPVPVQGIDAPQAIANAIARFNAVPLDHDQRPEVLIVGRGGGSAEDLWAFNEEVVARTIADSDIPIISAVGHETDVSIADFVADERAATPSMAAEIAVPDRRDLELQIRGLTDRLRDAAMRPIDGTRRRVRHLIDSRTFHEPVRRLRDMQQRVDGIVEQLHRSASRMIERRRHVVERLQDRIRAAHPKAPLRRGYAMIERDGQIVRSVANLTTGDRVQIRLDDGHRSADIVDEGDE
ncbi:exodeoxyribonuclease VII large subunit [Longibacter salinarum]|uniref:exodeoxyribonuclease VII large subunit n=1 Tax=Longibacter salinarum TaxID=1850348 RepID=UPI0015CF24B7|nr:exodeoxyribonuclease VII large subunit [Longibacter salinarum]